jgi:hypothetical protein
LERKKEETTSCCGGNCDAESMAKAEHAKTEGASVKILGSGCAKCNQLGAATKEALKLFGMDTTIDGSLFKMLYLAMMDITNKWTRRRQDWNIIHAQLSICFEDRMPG